MKGLKFTALALGVLLAYGSTAAAEEKLLGAADLSYGEGQVRAELWGDVLSGGYARNLIVMLKNDGKILTAYTPGIQGGYNCLLEAVQLTADEPQQLLLSVGQGDWTAPSQFRVLDFTDPEEVREIFSGSDNLGLVSEAYINEENEKLLEITLKDGTHHSVALPEGLEGKGRLFYGGLDSLVPYDVDDDGVQELLTSQQISRRRKLLADVGAVWDLQDDGSWKQYSLTIMTSVAVKTNNKINEGLHFAAGSFLPRKLVVPGGEATYPVFVGTDLALQDKINALLASEMEPYLDSFYEGKDDLGFRVIRADDLLFTVQLISGKDNFRHHNINIDPSTGNEIKLTEVLNAKEKDLLPLLNILNTNKKVVFKDKLPEEWYLEGRRLFLMQDVNGEEQVSGFAIGNLHKYLLDKKWLGNKTD